MKAIWNNQVIAESNDIVELEGNKYFPKDAIRSEHFESSASNSVCPWKGTAHYYTIRVSGEENVDAAWYYPDPSEKASSIRDRIAFWKGVSVVD